MRWRCLGSDSLQVVDPLGIGGASCRAGTRHDELAHHRRLCTAFTAIEAHNDPVVLVWSDRLAWLHDVEQLVIHLECECRCVLEDVAEWDGRRRAGFHDEWALKGTTRFSNDQYTEVIVVLFMALFCSNHFTKVCLGNLKKCLQCCLTNEDFPRDFKCANNTLNASCIFVWTSTQFEPGKVWGGVPTCVNCLSAEICVIHTL